MKAQLLMLSAATLLAAAAPATAADRQLQAFETHAQAAADARLAGAGVTLPAAITKVRGTIGSDGHLMNVHVVGSTGSRDTDYAVEKALKRLDVGQPPVMLVGADLTLSFGPAEIQQAGRPATPSS